MAALYRGRLAAAHLVIAKRPLRAIAIGIDTQVVRKRAGR
jgi:hypothetical protein